MAYSSIATNVGLNRSTSYTRVSYKKNQSNIITKEKEVKFIFNDFYMA